MITCLRCEKLEAEVARLTAENTRLLEALANIAAVTAAKYPALAQLARAALAAPTKGEP